MYLQGIQGHKSEHPDIWASLWWLTGAILILGEQILKAAPVITSVHTHSPLAFHTCSLRAPFNSSSQRQQGPLETACCQKSHSQQSHSALLALRYWLHSYTQKVFLEKNIWKGGRCMPLLLLPLFEKVYWERNGIYGNF